MEHRQDIVLGAVFAALGLAATWLAMAYSGATGTYPMVLGLILLALGIFVIVRALRVSVGRERALMPAPGKLVLTAGVFVVYVALVVPLGFYMASALLMLLLPLLLGFHQPLYLAIMAMVFIAVLYLMFSVVLEKPLPTGTWSSVWLAGRA